MNKYFSRTILTIIFFLSYINSAEARNDLQDFSIKEALSTPKAEQKLNKNIHLYFGKQKHAKVQRSFGDFSTSKKTNAFNKSDKQACEWVFLSAVLQMQKKAKQLGANAIINIKSNYNRNVTSNQKTFKCAVGNIIAGVALTGTFVKTK